MPHARAGRPPRSADGFRRYWWVFPLVPLLLVVGVVAALYVSYQRITLPEALPPIRSTFIYDRDGNQIASLHGAVDRTLVGSRRDLAQPAARGAGDRGRRVLRAPRLRPGRHLQGRLHRSGEAGDRGRRLDDHPAVGEERVRGPVHREPRRHRRVRGSAAHDQDQGSGDPAGDQARGRADQEPDPHQVPQHRLLRARRLRGRGGGEDLLRQGCLRADDPRGRDARRRSCTRPRSTTRSTAPTTTSSAGTTRSTRWPGTATSPGPRPPS